jgi:hypothetical protein
MLPCRFQIRIVEAINQDPLAYTAQAKNIKSEYAL